MINYPVLKKKGDLSFSYFSSSSINGLIHLCISSIFSNFGNLFYSKNLHIKLDSAKASQDLLGNLAK